MTDSYIMKVNIHTSERANQFQKYEASTIQELCTSKTLNQGLKSIMDYSKIVDFSFHYRGRTFYSFFPTASFTKEGKSHPYTQKHCNKSLKTNSRGTGATLM